MGGGGYRKRNVIVDGEDRIWWLRYPIAAEVQFDWGQVATDARTRLTRTIAVSPTIQLSVEVHVRPHGDNTLLATVCMVNRGQGGPSIDEGSLFQTALSVELVGPQSEPMIMPYPQGPGAECETSDVLLDLLYRKCMTFAVGHGCAADWEMSVDGTRAYRVMAECFPVFETPSISPEVLRDDFSSVSASMAALGGLIPGDDGLSSLEEIMALYRSWIAGKRDTIPLLPMAHQAAARAQMDECESTCGRMETGLEYIRNDPISRRAFELANHAMLLQQASARKDSRKAAFNSGSLRFSFSEPYKEVNWSEPGKGHGYWRPFQIAFILMGLKSVAEGADPFRDTVELVWFPTGGGKTEAYLGQIGRAHV